MQQKAIAVLGPPAAGKTSLLRQYNGRVIHIGEFTKRIPSEHPVKQRCMEHWRQRTTFSPDLLEELIGMYPMPDARIVLLDGTPRNREQEVIVARYFNLLARVFIEIDDVSWEQRAFDTSKVRPDRLDSDFDMLWQRKERYKAEIEYARQLPNNFFVNNAGSFDRAQVQLAEALREVELADLLGGRTNDRIHGYRG